jgi:ribosome-binding protein aMBF1 (putative translation factor)|tara:strand:- start:1988 stop:2326 length:339 start_codon:yes stop_codon:yes gene_type:complete
MSLEPPSDYVRVYQTWNLLKRVKQPVSTNEADPSAKCVTSLPVQQELRHTIQMARVERCLSIQELSVKIKCSPETLSAFERGDEVLSEDMQNALKSVLNIDSAKSNKKILAS